MRCLPAVGPVRMLTVCAHAVAADVPCVVAALLADNLCFSSRCVLTEATLWSSTKHSLLVACAADHDDEHLATHTHTHNAPVHEDVSPTQCLQPNTPDGSQRCLMDSSVSA